MLFEALWIVRDPAAPCLVAVRGCGIDDPAGLAAWGPQRRDEPTGDNELLARLSTHRWPIRCRVSRWREGRIVAGAAANRGAGVAGLTNLFFGDEPPATIAGAISAAIASRLPGLPIVDYEQADRAQEFRRAGFRILAPLAVWIAG
jgi:hypothetical protein